MLNRKTWRLAIAIVLIVPVETKYSSSADSILVESDNKLLPVNCKYKLELTTVYDSGKTKTQKFEGYKKGNLKNVLIITKPKRIAGSVHLRNDRIIWSYYTTNKKLMKVSYKAIFMNSLLNYGDIMSAEFSTSYNVTNKEENDKSYILTLAPKPGAEGYGKIVLTIDKNTLLPQKREYYALSGILLKVSEYKEIRVKNNQVTYIEQDFYEPLKNRKSTIVFSEVKPISDIPEKYYNANYIKYLSGE